RAAEGIRSQHAEALRLIQRSARARRARPRAAGAAAPPPSPFAPPMNAPRSSFGTLNGRDVGLTTLRAGALEVRVLDYGATVQALLAPDRYGNTDDVVLGFERLQDYVDNTVFLGGTVGRVANRIARGRFELDGQAY